jgi:hypothetical protein
MKSKAFRGVPETFALAQPFMAPAHPGNGTGMLWGIDLRTRKPLFIDGWALRDEGVLNGLVLRADGIRGSGKSTFLKVMAFRMMSLQAGRDTDGRPEAFRVRITDQKPENGRPEYERLTQALQSEVIRPIKDSRKINPFDPEMGDLFSLLETSINLAETLQGHPLTGLAPLAHQVAVSKMYFELREASSPEVLEAIFMRLTVEDVKHYYDQANAELIAQLQQRLEDRPDLMERFASLLEQPNKLPAEAFEAAASEQGAVMSRLTKGEYGVLFGQGTSMRSLLSQPVATIDRSGMSLKVRTIFEALIWRWQSWALEHDQRDLIPHLEIGDEEHDSYASLMYLRFYDDYVRKARAFHTWSMRATQFSTQLDQIGDEGSEARQLAKSISLGVSMRVIGRQQNDADVLNGLTALGLSDEDAQFCTTLPTGCFGLKIPDLPVIFFQMLLTPTELDLVQSNAATKRMMARVNVNDLPEVQARIAAARAVQEEEV